MDTPSIDCIIPDQLYIGNLSAANSLEHRKRLGITHILSVCPECPSQGTNHLHIPVEDSEYEDLLIHLPKSCLFIQTALEQGGRVLVHCVMGISRSVTVVCAYLMESRHLSATKALSVVKSRRPSVHPNYGFIKQLQVFEKCSYRPSATNVTYISWKRRQAQDVTNYLNAVHDTAAIIPDRLFLSSDYPHDPIQAKCLLHDMEFTHLLSLSPSENISPSRIPSTVKHYHINIPNRIKQQEESFLQLMIALPDAVAFVASAINCGGQVLVHCEVEWKAAVVVCAYLMSSRHISPSQATAVLEEGLPLFNGTRNFTKHLELYEACSYAPSADHPYLKSHLSVSPSSSSTFSRSKTNVTLPLTTKSHATNVMLNATSTSAANSKAANAAAITALANKVFSGTGLDSKGFGETLAKIQASREGVVSHG